MRDLYFGGDMEAAIALGGQVMGRIESVRSVQDIIWSTIDECRATIRGLHRLVSVDASHEEPVRPDLPRRGDT